MHDSVFIGTITLSTSQNTSEFGYSQNKPRWNPPCEEISYKLS